MAKVTIAACDNCGRHLLTATDGLIIHGHAIHPGSSHAFVGRAEPTREATPSEYCLCWPCWHKVAKDPMKAREEPEERTDR